MDFDQTLEYLLSLGNEVAAMKLGLESISKVLEAIGNPQKNYLKVQVAGTNGKGSVCAFLNTICVSAGIRTGMFTSPHLISITERVQIDGVPISDDDFAKYATKVRSVAEDLVANGTLESIPTFFEQVTAIALLAFSDAQVEVAILETGLGGRLDATTAANAEIAAITRIDYDHQEYLGETIEEIAAEKAAIITDQTREVIIGAQSTPVMAMLRKRCSELGIEPLNNEDEPWRVLLADGGKVQVDLSLISWPPITLGLKGKHQIENAQTAIQATKALLYHGIFPTGEEGEVHVVEGLRNARHPGRLESIGRYLLDGAHNPGGARALRAYLDEEVDRPITLIFGAMKDKDVGEIAEILFPIANVLILTRPNNERAIAPAELELLVKEATRSVKIVTTDSVAEALKMAVKLSSPDNLLLVTGSLYLVGEVKSFLQASDNILD
jgi:dihydrofolate synthase/folylpolyglutamate synthase